ncbi:hypothetical protein BDN70DRAFT_764398, partial [Pholiota conissans]
QHPGYAKLVNFCRVALEDHQLALGWMDTVCINKSSSSELDESIRSMYKWYEMAGVCITYLAETDSLSDMPNDAWFTRGWTLQELIAPKHVKFYMRTWNRLIGSHSSDKKDDTIHRIIESATTIAANELQYPDVVSISRKMQWAASRQVTRAEDGAYSLMGLLGVSMSIAYGEGAEHAFIRLLKGILSTSNTDVLDVFNWGG